MNWLTSSTRTFGLSLAIAGSLALGLTPSIACAQDAPGNAPVAESDSGSAPGVARISDLQSNVAVKRGDSGDTVAAAINAPVMAGDYLTTGDDSRAEVQFDNADILRAGSNAQLRFTQLGAGGDTTQLAAGTVELRSFQQSSPLEIDTPSITIRPTDAGAYRVTVDDSGTTFVTVRSGEASIVTPQGTQALGPGNTLQASGSATNPQISSVATVALDPFDSWNDQRDQLVASANAPDDNQNQYVDQGVVGSSDLAQDGTWQDDTTYGDVWVPNEAPGWAPYTNGQWCWEGYYGWTWVGNEPWGWAPYHYGRWFYGKNRWAWYPGPRYARPEWQPALVGFFGFGGGGLSVGIGFGNIGWVPLAPFEAYHPWYGGRGFGVNNFAVGINSYHNYNAPGAISGISTGAWNNGSFGRRVTLPPNEVRNVTAMRGTLPITPTHNNLGFSREPINGSNLPRLRTQAFSSFGSRSVTNRPSFDQDRARVQQAQSTTRTEDAWSRFNTQQGSSRSNYNTNDRNYNTNDRNYNTNDRNYNTGERNNYNTNDRSNTNNRGSYNTNYRTYDSNNTNNRGGTYNTNYRGSYDTNRGTYNTNRNTYNTNRNTYNTNRNTYNTNRGSYTSTPRYRTTGSGSRGTTGNRSSRSSGSDNHHPPSK